MFCIKAMFGGYIYSYAVKGTVSMTSNQGAYLTSMYWVRNILRTKSNPSIYLTKMMND